MKKSVSAIVAILAVVLCFTLSACGTKYKSRYSAKLMVESNTSKSASVSFDDFSGIYVIKWQNSGSDEVFITYEATLEEGNIKVSYDFNGEKRDLFAIGSDGSVDGKTETFTGNKTIYIILESDGNCSTGSFSFKLEKAEK